MLTKADQHALGATFEQAGVATVDPRKVTCLAFSSPDQAENEQVYSAANDLLVDLIKDNSVGHCVHVTGEMRALADPFHRRVCAEIHKRGQEKFSLIYSIPPSYRDSPEGVGQWNAESWRRSGWVDRLSAFGIIGKDIVDVFAYDTLDKIQFTVFGSRYLLLQEKHDDEVRKDGKGGPIPKRIWLLKCEKLNQAFAEKATTIKNDSEALPDALFRRFAVSIHGVASREIISRLIKSGGTGHREQILDDTLRRFDSESDVHLSALKTIGFVQCDGAATLTVTTEGRQYFATVGSVGAPEAGGVSSPAAS
jgi:hypothetical protein